MFEGMSYEEAAEVIDLPVGTAKSRLHFALAKLKELIVGC
jgi:DNA-directed RNA polymerase specialized sigma24 family protein